MFQFGPRAIIENGENGYLIPDREIEEMADKLTHLLENKQEREKMGRKAKEHAYKYLPENIMPLWYNILDIIKM